MRTLVVKVTCGIDDPERANQALTVAATAAASGVTVSLWLAGEASWFATTDRRPDLGLEGAAPASELVDSVLTFGRVTLCTQCATRRGIGEGDVASGVLIAGAAAFVEEVTADDVQALVY